MSTASTLLRDDLRGFSGYSSARSTVQQGTVWLNANESAQRNPADADGRCQRYPEPQPAELVARLADHYHVAAEQVLVGRGSDEGIDLLVRTFCAPGHGRVVIAPPTFGMYAVSARLHGASVIEVPLNDAASGFEHDLDAIAAAAIEARAALVFLCNPGNPTGSLLSLDALSTLADQLAGRALLVVDEAYGEYADVASATCLLATHDNIVVLRTLSKAHALAAARIGCVIAQPEVIAMLRRVQAPYPVPAPCIEVALDALQADATQVLASRVVEVRRERERMRSELSRMPGVRCVYPSAGNFLLVRLEDATAVQARLSAAGIVVRDMRSAPGLQDALRISIGTPVENAAVTAAIASMSKVAA